MGGIQTGTAPLLLAYSLKMCYTFPQKALKRGVTYGT